MSTAPKYTPHYTVTDYEQWQGDWELWQGTAVAMTPSPFGKHQHCAAKVLVAFSNQLARQDSQYIVLHEIDWLVSRDTIVRPDVVVIDGGVPERHLTSAPRVIVEILSPSTAEKDRSAKFKLYESERVPYYLLIDPSATDVTQAIELYRLTERQAYERIDALSKITLGPCQLTLDGTPLVEDNPE